MRYDKLGRAPGSLIPRQSPQDLVGNPGRSQNYDMAQTYLIREAALVRDLVGYFLKSPTLDKADQYWKHFSSQWKSNIINYIKNLNGVDTVGEMEIEHYKNHYRFRTAIRLTEEYVQRLAEIERIKAAHPNIPVERNQFTFGAMRHIGTIHSRLMQFSAQLKSNIDNPDSVIKR